MHTFMRKIGILAAALTTFLSASAYDFEADGIYYNITDQTDKTVEVTSGTNKYSGVITLPSSVLYDNEQYSVTAIGGCAFEECRSLTSITIPNSVTTIGEGVFSNCYGLTSITIPNSVTSIGNWAFDCCYGLTSMVIPNSVTTIGERAFSNCSGLTSITIPNSVTTIGIDVFSECCGLTYITVEIDNLAYSSSDGVLYDKLLTELICWPGGKTGEAIIPNSVTSIGEDAFSSCHGLTSITIPNSVSSIGRNAFCSCISLTSITIPNSVTTIEESVFSECRGLTSINIPNSVTTIGDEAFWYCSSLTSITIPNSVTTIGDEAFSWCHSLTSLTIPNSVKSIGESAFEDCISLPSITSLAVTPPKCEEDVFYGVDKSKCTLYVPVGSKEAYQQVPQWKDFLLVEEVEAGIEAVEGSAEGGTVEVFNLRGVKVGEAVEGLPAGIYLVRKGSAVRKVVVK